MCAYVVLVLQLCITLCHLMHHLTLDIVGEVFGSSDLCQPLLPLIMTSWLSTGDSQRNMVSNFVE